MTESFEAEVLTTEAGRVLLTEVAGVARVQPSDIARWRRSFAIEWVNAALRLVEGRRKGSGKFLLASQMWFDPVGVEQATSEDVARHKARRFPPSGLVVDLCSGIGGDSVALASQAEVIAVDLDQGMARRTLWNARVHEVAERLMAVRSRVEDFAIPKGARIHVDPDRRSSGRLRARQVHDYAPGLSTLKELVVSTVGGAIKLGPSSDFEVHFAGRGFEIELVSLHGECKEATVWFGDLAGPEVARRATCLPRGATWSHLDGPLRAWPREGPLQAFVFDPDPALTRSGLLDGFAEAHGLRRIEADVDLLSGPSAVDSPFLSNFEVVDVFPIDVKVMRREVAARGLGPLEIKTRGLPTRPEAYRAALRPAGPHPATWILVAGRGGPGRAILARRRTATPREERIEPERIGVVP